MELWKVGYDAYEKAFSANGSLSEAWQSAANAIARALAAMEPSLPMYEETKLYGQSPFSCVEQCKAYILAAADDGDV